MKKFLKAVVCFVAPVVCIMGSVKLLGGSILAASPLLSGAASLALILALVGGMLVEFLPGLLFKDE